MLASRTRWSLACLSGSASYRNGLVVQPCSYSPSRLYSSASASSDRSTFRNVSFWGHIDAGKTTLTERVLYLAKALSPPTSGLTGKSISNSQLPGDVDSGSTVTDFLEAERQRGITIQSAAVGPFPWLPREPLKGIKESNISLIDTPGHIDFTIEVERSLRVADGCVILIDGVEGVESQTESVWQIGQRYNVKSHIIFVNKLDRMGASLTKSVKSIITSDLHSRPTILQLPIFSFDSSSNQEASLIGIIDLTTRPLQAIFYGGKAGENVKVNLLHEAVQQGRVSEKLYEEARKGREALVEAVGSLDEKLLDNILSHSNNIEEAESPNDMVTTEELRSAIRRQTIQGLILPVLCGSAHKGIGIQSVLDAINWYLPSPDEAGDVDASALRGEQGGCVWGQVKGSKPDQSNQVSVSLKDVDLSLLAFKVVWDKQKGPMTFVRIYSGNLTRSATLFNTTTQTKERLSKILFPFADRFVETESLQAGQIGVLLGLKDTRTGDTLIDSRIATSKKPVKNIASWAQTSTSLRLRRVDVPLPVFSVSLEPMGKSDEGQVREALEMLIRTDPSLQIDYGDTINGGVGLGSVGTGQIVLSGMGELHLEIAKDRLLNEFHARAIMGNVRVSYRETLSSTTEVDAGETTWHVEELDRDIMGKKLKAKCQVGIRCKRKDEMAEDSMGGNVIHIDLGEGNVTSDYDTVHVHQALKAGLLASLSRGPISGNAILGLHITIRNLETFGPLLTPPKAITMVASQALTKAIKSRGLSLMEPVMKVRINCDEQYLGKVSSALASEQNGIVERVDHEASSSSTEAMNIVEQVYLPPEEDEWSARGSEQRRKNVSCSIYAVVPLVKLVNYSTKLRAITKGSGTFEMTLQGFTVVGPDREREILKELGRM